MSKQTVSLGNGTRIAYLERPGGSLPLLLLHGITDNALTFEPLLEQIDRRCHVYALDFRGHGESDKPDSRYDTDAYADDVRHFIREVVGDPALVLGHSLGAAVTVQLGVTAPELVRGMYLEDPPLYFVNDLNEIFRRLFEVMVQISRSLRDGSRSPDYWFEVMAAAPDPYSGRPGIEVNGVERIRMRVASIGQMKPQALEDALGGSLKWDTDAVLARLDRPLTMVVGQPELGAVITAAEAARAAGIVAGCQVVSVPEVGHLVHDQKPDVWLTTVNDWVAALA
jgi:pimeloyl-ACP methyl ester carboxylesterase